MKKKGIIVLAWMIFASTFSEAALILHYGFEEGKGALVSSSVNGTKKTAEQVSLRLKRPGKYTRWAKGKFGGGAELLTPGAMLFVQDPNAWNPRMWINGNEKTSVSLAFWLKPTKIKGHAAPLIVGSNGNSGYQVRGHKKVYGFVKSAKNKKIQDALNRAIISVGEWVHLVITFDVPTKTLKLYKNGAEVSSSTGSFEGWASRMRGTGVGSNDNRYQVMGVYDEIYLFNTVLTPDEIKNLAFRNTLEEPVVSEQSLVTQTNVACKIATEILSLKAPPVKKEVVSTEQKTVASTRQEEATEKKSNFNMPNGLVPFATILLLLFVRNRTK